jgi:hypothetical protein
VLSIRRRTFPDGKRLEAGFLQSSPQLAQLGDMQRVERESLALVADTARWRAEKRL